MIVSPSLWKLVGARPSSHGLRPRRSSVWPALRSTSGGASASVAIVRGIDPVIRTGSLRTVVRTRREPEAPGPGVDDARVRAAHPTRAACEISGTVIVILWLAPGRSSARALEADKSLARQRHARHARRRGVELCDRRARALAAVLHAEADAKRARSRDHRATDARVRVAEACVAPAVAERPGRLAAEVHVRPAQPARPRPREVVVVLRRQLLVVPVPGEAEVAGRIGLAEDDVRGGESLSLSVGRAEQDRRDLRPHRRQVDRPGRLVDQHDARVAERRPPARPAAGSSRAARASCGHSPRRSCCRRSRP